MENVIVMTFLIIESIVDLKKKSLLLTPLMAMVVIAFLWGIFIEKFIWGTLVGIVPGLIVFLLGFIRGEPIGKGDGVVLMIVGAFTDVFVATQTFLFANLFAFLISLFILVTKRGNKNTRIPFVPSILAGFVGVILCG